MEQVRVPEEIRRDLARVRERLPSLLRSHADAMSPSAVVLIGRAMEAVNTEHRIELNHPETSASADAWRRGHRRPRGAAPLALAPARERFSDWPAR